MIRQSIERSLVIVVLFAPCARAQSPDDATRAAVMTEAQAAKTTQLHPYVPGKAEKYLDRAEEILTTGMHWHPFFESAYSGGGFTLGAGYRSYVGSYASVDVRGSITPSGYKRIESEFLAPRVLRRRASLSIVGGWREATRVGFYGVGMQNSQNDRVNYGFKQPYGGGTLTYRPQGRLLLLRGGADASQWYQAEGTGDMPSVEQKTTVAYIHSQATVALDSRSSPGYARRGGSYGVTFHNFMDPGGNYGFTQIDYEAVQHVPLGRDAWVASFRAGVSTTGTKADQDIPFFMLPALGGGSSLRGFSSWRFRDRNSLQLSAEWRVIANRFLDMAVFYDAGKVTAHTSDLDLSGLKSDYGLGFRLHGALSTPLRIDLAKSNEGFSIVWAASAAF